MKEHIKRTRLWRKLAALRFRLWQKLALLVFLIMLPLLGVIFFNFLHFFGDLTNIEINDHLRDARAVSISLNRFVHELASEGQVTGLAITENNLSQEQATAYLESVHGHVPTSNVFITNPNGLVFAASQPGLDGKDFAGDQAFQSVVKGAPFSVSNLRTNPNGRLGFIVFSRVMSDGDLAGVAGVAVDGVDLGRILPIQGHDLVMITDGLGNLVFSNQAALEKLPVSKRNFSNQDFVKRAMQGQDFKTSGTVIPYLDGSFLGAQVPVAEIKWTAGVYDVAGEALAHVGTEIGITSGIVAAIVLVIIIAAAIFVRGVSKPVTRLTGVTNEIAKGNFDVPVDIHPRDEIGLLAENFSRMQSSLKRTFGDVASLASASRQINSSLKVTAVGHIAADYLTKTLSAKGLIVSISRGDIRLLIARNIDEGTAERLSRAIAEMVKETDAGERGYAIVQLTEAMIERLGDRTGESTVLVVLPLIVKGEPVGRIDVFATPAADLVEFERADVRLAASFAQQVAVAVENARLFEEQRVVADVLQESLLTKPQYNPDLEIGLAYYPTTHGARIGGDFYDFFSISDDKMIVVVGDISGKGIEAARFTAVAKGAIRSFALEDPMPDSVLTRASRVIAEQTRYDIFITAVYMVIDTRAGVVQYAVAGHPPPLLYKSDLNRVVPLGGRGIPLGTLLPESYKGLEARVSPGDKLIVYTDGLTEARRDGELFGEERLVEVIHELKEVPTRDLANRIAERAIEFAGGNLTDDLAVVSLERRV